MNFARTAAAAYAAVLALAAGCAQSIPPPGGEVDRTPPAIIATTPDTQSVVPEFDDEVKFEFDERISERGAERSVLVSPATGEVHVHRGRASISVKLDGGWRPNEVYRVILLPGVRDLFGNERREPAELVFSTGPPIPATAVAGVVLDRITGRPATKVIVDALRRTDSVTYSTVGDSVAFFALRFMPQGNYELRAWIDQNENRRRDASESLSVPQAFSLNTSADTIITELSVVPADTTPPKLLRAEVRDSLQVRIFSDDYLDPDASLEFAEVTLHVLPDSTPVPGTHRAVSGYRYDRDRAIADSIARASAPPRDSTARDSTASRDTTGARAPRRNAIAGPPPTRGDSTLPSQEFVVIPGTPLQPKTRYAVTVDGLTNISARSGGGGTVTFETPEPPRIGPDTTRTRPDTTVTHPDTTGARPDTLIVRLDTPAARTGMARAVRNAWVTLFAKRE